MDKEEQDKLRRLVNASYTGDLETVKEIIETGFNPDKYSSDVLPAIVAAAMSGYDTIIEYLLSKGANIDQCDDNKRNALKSAAGQHHISTIRLLLMHNANVNIEREGDVALTIFCDGLKDTDEHQVIFQMLLERTDKLYYQKAYEYCLFEKYRKMIQEAAPEITFIEPEGGFGGKMDKMDQRCRTAPKDPLLRKIWELLNYYKTIQSKTTEPNYNDLFEVILYLTSIGGSTEKITLENFCNDWLTEILLYSIDEMEKERKLTIELLKRQNRFYSGYNREGFELFVEEISEMLAFDQYSDLKQHLEELQFKFQREDDQ